MRFRLTRKIPLLIVAFALVFPLSVLAARLQGRQPDMKDPAGNLITGLDVSAVGGASTDADGLSLTFASRSPSKLTQHDYQHVYDRAMTLLQNGAQFRTEELLLGPQCTTEEDCLRFYRNEEDVQALFERFCSEYTALDEDGYCPQTVPPDEWLERNDKRDVRNQLVRAREMFAFLSLAEPVDTTIQVGDESDMGKSVPRVSARELGRTGVLSVTRELANIHLLFGNELMVSALQYRFSTTAVGADLILDEELKQLEWALEQFTAAVDVLAHAFNADYGGPDGVYLGDYFTAREFELFGMVSERMVLAMGEIATRYRQQGEDDKALAVYAQGFTNQYMQALGLAQKAAERDANFLENGGWEMMNNLERLRAQAQSIYDGINPFGFKPEYVPLQTYTYLDTQTRDIYLATAKDFQKSAADSQREFDYNAAKLRTQLGLLRENYGAQLLDLCGASDDADGDDLADYDTCEGGLMEQNYYAVVAAAKRVQLAITRTANITKTIQVEQERAGEVIDIILEGGERMSAIEYAQGVLRSYRVTNASVNSTSESWSFGTEFRTTTGYSFNPIANILGSPTGASTWSVFAGKRWAETKTHSVRKIWDPSQVELGELNSERALRQAVDQASIEGANSEARIKNLLLEQAVLLLEVDIAIDEYNRLAAEHNSLVERYHNLLNLREQAREDLFDSYVTNPAWRILRDTRTVEASHSFNVAAQFTYLTAKALEYEYLTRPPFLNEVYKARTVGDLEKFLNRLSTWRDAVGPPDERLPYRISVARDLLGFSDQSLDPEGDMTPGELAELRFELFQEYLQDHIDGDTLTFPFTTSLLAEREGGTKIFSPNVWNHRIAGVGLPKGVHGTRGVSVNVLTRQFGDIGTPEVILTHAGHATYRRADGSLVEYEPQNARPSGYIVPNPLKSKTSTAIIFASVNGNGAGTHSPALFNRSVAASNWTLRIDMTAPENRELDLAQIEDIEILMDTTGMALQGRAAAVKDEAQRLQAAFVQ